MTTLKACRICGGADLRTALDLELMPLANSLLPMDLPDEPEHRYPLTLVYCANCTLTQITETVPPEILFRDYTYFSSYSDTMLAHAREMAETLIRTRKLSASSRVVEIGSNDGYLLQNFVRKKIPALGVEPAQNVALVATEERGVPTINKFFGLAVARELVAEGIKADLIIGNNVLAHVADLHDLLSGVAALLKPTGAAVFEVPYLVDLCENGEFDTIYHEHLCYFSLTALKHLFQSHGLAITDVQRIPIHGGSIRITAEAADRQGAAAVDSLIHAESQQLGAPAGHDIPELLARFAHRTFTLREDIRNLLNRLAAEGRTVAAYGAAAKGCVLMNFCDLGQDLVQFVTDRNPVKQNRRMPGTHQPIYSPEKLREAPPDYLLILPWNIADEIARQESDYHARGGRFIIPVPEVRVQ